MNPTDPSLQRWQVAAADRGLRLDQLIALRIAGCSRHQAVRLIAEGRVRVDGRRAAKGQRLAAGQEIAVALADAGPAPALPEAAFLVITEALLIVDKPAGLPCHALGPGGEDALLERVARRFDEVRAAGPDPREGGLLHRLDVDTSGCVAFARRREAHAALRAALADRSACKRYLAVVEDPQAHLPVEGELDRPLARARGDAGRMVVQGSCDAAVRGPWLAARTRYRVRGRGAGLALVEVEIGSGRMHQIRAHLAAAGHPLLGDRRYGQGSDLIGRQALHAWELHLRHGEDDIAARAPLPEDLQQLLARTGLDMPGHG